MAKPNQKIVETDYSGFIGNLNLAIVVAQFNSHITDRLLTGCVDFLKSKSMREEQLTICKVPGAFEIPKAALWFCHKKGIDGIITLGAVIQGGTRHFDYVCTESAKGIMDLNLRYDIPISYGILTCNTEEQAFERAGGNHGNKGADSARAVLDMIALKRML